MSCRIAFLPLVGMLLLGAGTSLVRAEPPEGYPFLRYDEGLKLAQERKKKVFLYFGRVGCAWCEIVNKQAFSDPALKKKYVDHYVLVYADSEGGERLQLPSGERITEAELGVRFKAFATPLFVWLEPTGEPIFKAPGIQTVKDFDKYDRFVYDGIYKQKTAQQFLAENP